LTHFAGVLGLCLAELRAPFAMGGLEFTTKVPARLGHLTGGFGAGAPGFGHRLARLLAPFPTPVS
jgi:hypothetical protein